MHRHGLGLLHSLTLATTCARDLLLADRHHLLHADIAAGWAFFPSIDQGTPDSLADELRSSPRSIMIECMALQETYFDDGLSEGHSLRAKRDRFNWYLDHLAELRGDRPPAFRGVVPQGKPAARRWGARAREQRTKGKR